MPRAFLQRSRPQLLTAAAWSGLRPAPKSRSRRAYPHLSRSCATAIVVSCFPLSICLCSTLKLRKMRSASLVPGRYIYAGSAYGPGGLKARLSRHMRRTKVERWHIDQLTKTGVRGAWIFPGCNECDLVVMNSALPVPIVGFGSTDCKRCRSHLLGPMCYSSIDPHNIGQGWPAWTEASGTPQG
jgi:Uri superfamily endonuclease